MAHSRPERHGVGSSGWLRAAVLGANDGILSTAGLLVGVAAAQATRHEILIAGVSAIAAGALSMASGEYVSVSSQADAEHADLQKERRELATDPVGEHAELVGIYVSRGLEPELADKVATQLAAKDALATHARDELGITATVMARPLQAASASALSYVTGAVLPLIVAMLAPQRSLVPTIAGLSLLCLGTLGALAARAGGAPVLKGTLRVLIWGAVAMAVTTALGRLADQLLH